MDALKRFYETYFKFLGDIPPSQRLTLIVLPVLVMAVFGGLIWWGQTSGSEALMAGKVFSRDELKQADEALRRAGLNDFRSDGGKILVPQGQATRYNAALVASGATPAQFGTEFDKLHEKYGMFASEKQRQEMLELAKAKELAKIIRAIPDIEDAGVIWERGRRRGFTGDSKVTATVSVLPKAGRDLPGSLVHSLRLSVAGAVADLAVHDVTVLNMRTGLAYRAQEQDDPFNSQVIDHVQRFTNHHQKVIGEALQYIPNVVVSVNVDIDNLKTSWEQERRFEPKTVPLRSVDEQDNFRSNERRPNNEPGVVPNRGADARQVATIESTRTNEKTRTTSDNVPLSTKVSEKSFTGLLPKSVQVSISIPKDYYKAIALKQGESESDKTAFEAKLKQIQADEEKNVSQIVAKLIPQGSPTGAVNVSSYVRLDGPASAVATPWAYTVGELVAQWGSTVGLAVFALVVLMMLQRSMKSTSLAPETEAAQASGVAAAKGKATGKKEVAAEDDTPRPETKRDRLQREVKDNPEAAAAVLSKWFAAST